MKYLFLFILSFILLNVNAQCDQTSTKIMVLGDSWAFFSWDGNSYNENLDRFGYSDIKAKSNIAISILGSKASNYFDEEDRRIAVQDFMDSNPDLEVIHFSLGGNDILRNWDNTMTSIQEDSMLNDLILEIRSGMDTLWSYNPNLHIHFSGYEYPNFAETVETLTPTWLQEQHPFFDLWEEMGRPTPTELNGIVIKGTQIFQDSIAIHPNVSFINNLGLMQWHYGQEDPLEVFPFGTYEEHIAPVPGGYPTYPSPLDALNFGGNDSFHLNDDAYEIFIKRHFKEYYWSFFRKADDTFKGETSHNKTVSVSGIFDEITLGNTDEVIKSILTFNTSDLENKEIEEANIFIKRSGISGENLINESVLLEIKSDHFGNNLQIELEDFNVAPDTSFSTCTYGSLEENDYWMRIDIPIEMIPFINYSGMTQFRLSYDITENDRNIVFNNEEENILLDITYGDEIVDLIELASKDIIDIELYPNPTSSNLIIHSKEEIIDLKILDNLGNIVKDQFSDLNKINIHDLDNGIYFLKILTARGEVISKFIKK